MRAYKHVGERQRILDSVTFEESSTLSTKLPLDTVIKKLMIRMSGSVTTTFGSGTPVADAFSIMDNLVSRIEVAVDGGRVIKSVRPHFMNIQQLLTQKIAGERRSSAAAAAATDNFPTVDQGFVYGTTGQVSTVAETIEIAFECPYVEQKEATWLDLRGASSAQVTFSTRAFSSLLGFGNTAPVVFSASTISFQVTTLEAGDDVPDLEFWDWRQTTFDESFSGETVERKVKLNTGQKIMGVMMLARDGAAGTATTATGKLANNLVLGNIQITANGSKLIKKTNFKALQAENRVKFGVSAPMASNVSRLDGMAYLQLIERRDIDTALDARDLDSVELYLSTQAASLVSYTNPAIVTIMVDEIVIPRR